MLTPALSELLGFLLGVGCRSDFVYRGDKIREVAFTGNPSEYGYYRDFVRKTVTRYFGCRGYLGLRKDNTVRLHFRSQPLADFLDHFAVPVGKRRDAVVPRVVLGDDRLFRRFVRGFYHAEGSYYHRYSKRYNRHPKVYSNLLVIQFRNKLGTLMNQVHSGINRMGIRTTRLTEKGNVYTFRITDQGEIRRFLRVLRPVLKVKPRTL